MTRDETTLKGCVNMMSLVCLLSDTLHQPKKAVQDNFRKGRFSVEIAVETRGGLELFPCLVYEVIWNNDDSYCYELLLLLLSFPLLCWQT